MFNRKNAGKATGAVAAAMAGVLLSAGGAAAAVVVTESFETSPGTFTSYGTTASRDCTTTAHTGVCSLKVDPAGAGWAGASYDPTPDIDMYSRATVTFAFRAETTGGNVDADFVIDLDAGGQIVVHPTEGINNGVSLITNVEQDRGFDSWSTANTWYTFTVVIDTTADTATLSWSGGSNTSTLAIPATSTKIRKLDARGIRWGSGSPVRYDSISVATCTLTVGGLCL